MFRNARAVTLVLFLAAGIVCGQTPDTAILSGHITDQSNAVVPGARVTVENSMTGFERSAVTDASGGFSMAGLSVAGTYRLIVQMQGFTDQTVGGVALVAGSTAEVNVELALSAGMTQVTVIGNAGGVRADQPQLGLALGAQQVETTPLINRRITYLPLLSSANRPALNQGDVFMNQNLFTTNGTGRRQAWFEVDGLGASDAWGRQTIFTNFGVDAVQEMDVLTSAFSAQSGFTAGSVINIVTQRGGDQFHGSVLALGRPSGMEARLSGFTPTTATNGNQLTNDVLAQGGASFSGPLANNGRTQFFAQSEYSWQNRTSPITSPIAPGEFLGRYRDWLALFRLDHQFSERNSMFMRANLDRYYDTNPSGAVGGNNLPSVGRIFRKGTYAIAMGHTAILSPTVLNNLRLQFQLASPITQFDPVVYGTQFVVPISTGGTFTSGTSQAALLMNRQYEANDVVSIARSRHTITFGGDILGAHNGGNGKEFGGPIFLGQFAYNTCTQALSVCESAAYLNDINNVKTYTQSYGNAQYLVDDTLWSLFVQDEYKLRRDLTVNLGLRYERQTFTDFKKGFAPRVGFAYNVRGRGDTVIRGGYGIYYSQIVDNLAANYALSGPTGVFNYTAAPGQVGFPTSVAAAPLPALPAAAVAPVRSLYVRPGESTYLSQFFPTSVLLGYQDALLSPYTQQWTIGIERKLKAGWLLDMDYVGSHSLRINRPLDVNPPSSFVRTVQGQSRSAQAANCTRPYWIFWYAQAGMTCDPAHATNPQPPYGVIMSDVNNGYAHYNALDVNLSRHFSHGVSLLAGYTWSHATNNVDPDIPGQNPNDPRMTGAAEVGDAIFDQRHRFVLSGVYTAPFAIRLGGVATLASGLPYNVVTGTTNGGDNGGETARPVVNGAIIPRNAGRGRPIYDVSPFVARAFNLGRENLSLNLRAEAFNFFNHPNFVGYSGTYGNGTSPGAGFGNPLSGITNQLPAREFQFSIELLF
ncbi:MAG: carboxypeptidase regulatory-like domain-containing protein [Deltaproteobacteria bacterium]